MYAQRNPSSGTLLTHAFNPPSTEDHFSSQSFLEQQQQYNQEQLEEIQLNSVQLADSNSFHFQPFDNNNLLGNSLPAGWSHIYGDDMNGLIENTGFNSGVFVGDLISQTFVNDNSSWPLSQSAELNHRQQEALSTSPSEADSEQTNESAISSHTNEHVRAQTPGPFHKINVPQYLTARRRSLSADNIRAFSKVQQLSNRKGTYPVQHSIPQAISFEHAQFSLQNAKQQTIPMQDTRVNQNIVHANNQNTSQIDNDNDADHNHQQNNSGTTSPTPQQSRLHLSRSVSHQQINHTQRFNEYQARFKVKLDKRTQRSMPNIQLTAAAHAAMTQPSSAKANPSVSGSANGAMPIELNTSTASTAKPSNQPRRGHMRKRSLSAPTTPFPNLTQQSPGSIPLQPAQPFPLNFPMAFRRPNALPIQIQRNPKHLHASTPMSSEEYQRKLDEELEKVDFEDITVSELKEMLRQRGKPATGKKAILMQRLQEEVEFVKVMKNNNQQLKNSNTQYSQMLSSPTSPPGVSLQRSIANLHISSPPIHSRRFSPYGSVSIPGSPRIIPSGPGNGRSSFSGNIPYSESDEWPFHNNGMVSPLIDDTAVQSHTMMMIEQSQEMYRQQQPSSAPATTTEFEQAFQQQPSSAPPMTTEFDTFEFMNMMSIGPDMIRLSVNVENLKHDPSENKPSANDSVDEMLRHQALEFDFNPQMQDEHMMIKSEDFLNFPTMTSQQLPMQLELPQDGMTYSSEW